MRSLMCVRDFFEEFSFARRSLQDVLIHEFVTQNFSINGEPYSSSQMKATARGILKNLGELKSSVKVLSGICFVPYRVRINCDCEVRYILGDYREALKQDEKKVAKMNRTKYGR